MAKYKNCGSLLKGIVNLKTLDLLFFSSMEI